MVYVVCHIDMFEPSRSMLFSSEASGNSKPISLFWRFELTDVITSYALLPPLATRS
ncbi:hypothetical protein J6590_103459, partial [Homalodisca vitripennis]